MKASTKEVLVMSLGTSLAQARRKAGLTQEAVAEKLGVSRQTISKWELDETRRTFVSQNGWRCSIA